MPREVPPDLIEFAANTRLAWERDRARYPTILDITQTTEGLIFHVLDDGSAKVVIHSWDDMAQKRDDLLKAFLGESAAA